jgi:hypothetical protein
MDRIRRIVDVAGALKDERDEEKEWAKEGSRGEELGAERLSLSPATG